MTETPIPPQSRHRWHLEGIALGLIGGPVSFFLASGVASPLMVSANIAAPLLVPVVIATMLILVGQGCWAARSATAAGVAGGMWGIAGLLAEFGPDAIIRLVRYVPRSFFGLNTRSGAGLLLDSGGVLLVGASLLGIAGAATIARRHGRRIEASEHRRLTSGRVTVPPRSRLEQHIIAPVLAVAISVPVIAVANRIGPDALGTGTGTRESILLLGLATGAALVGLTGALSSLGPGVGGALWFVSFLWAQLSDPLTTPEWTSDAMGTTGWVAAALLGGAIGVHYARKDGRATQHREFQLAAD